MSRFIFGPVNSRRLGVSLGIDLLPHKTCSFDCIYCECGKTTEPTFGRSEFFKWEDIRDELDEFLSEKPKLDYITFSGSGEPTLSLHVGRVIDHIKENYPQYKVALLTNSTLLSNVQLLKEIKNVDLIVPSLDSATDEGIMKIDRPHIPLSAEKIIEDIKNLRNHLSAEIWLEILLIKGINDTKEELKELQKAVKYIKPDKVQLNTLDRPGTEKDIEPVNIDEIHEYLLGDEVVRKDIKDDAHIGGSNSHKGAILDTILRRPQTSQELSVMLNIPIKKVEEITNFLKDRGEISLINNFWNKS